MAKSNETLNPSLNEIYEIESNTKQELSNLQDEINEELSVNSSFWWVPLEYSNEYSVPWIWKPKKIKNKYYNCRLSKWLGTVMYENAIVKANWKISRETHKETYYSQKRLPWKSLKIPWRHVAKDWTIRDKDGYIVVATNYLPKWSIIMTTLWPWKVYDRWWMKWKRIDIYTNR